MDAVERSRLFDTLSQLTAPELEQVVCPQSVCWHRLRTGGTPGQATFQATSMAKMSSFAAACAIV
jgi:hypothetical protein